MKTNRKQHLLLLLFLGFSYFGMSQATSIYEKNYHYDVDANARLIVDSQFSDIILTSWDKNEVQVDVYVKTESKKQEKADRMLEKIRVDVSGGRSEVNITSSLKSSHSDDKNTFDIRLTIKAPASMHLKFESQFGDCQIPVWNGVVDLDMMFGDLDIEKLTNGEGKVEVQYSALTIDEAKELELHSSFSEVNIQKLANLNVDSQYDKVKIGTMGEIVGDFQFTDLEIEYLGVNMELESQYGSIDVGEVGSDFKKIDIENGFGEVHINTANIPNYYVEVEMNFASFRCDCTSQLQYKKIGFNEENYWGQIGSGGGRIQIESDYGGVRFK